MQLLLSDRLVQFGVGWRLTSKPLLTPHGVQEKRVNIDFEPFKPINTSLYLCDNKFHTEALNELLESDNRSARAAIACGLAGCMRTVRVFSHTPL